MDEGASNTPDESSGSLDAVSLTARQRAFSDALAAKDPTLAQMYLSAVTVLAQTNNPGRFAFASQGLREVMRKIPRYVDVETAALNQDMGQGVRRLEEVWIKTIEQSSCRQNSTWSGEIDRPLMQFLERLTAFFEWLADSRPQRRAAIIGTVQRLDPSGTRLPEPLEQRIYDTWDMLQKYFNAVCHFGKTTTENEFNQARERLEDFLADRLSPRTFADFDEIDAIIAEDEGHA